MAVRTPIAHRDREPTPRPSARELLSYEVEIRREAVETVYCGAGEEGDEHHVRDARQQVVGVSPVGLHLHLNGSRDERHCHPKPELRQRSRLERFKRQEADEDQLMSDREHELPEEVLRLEGTPQEAQRGAQRGLSIVENNVANLEEQDCIHEWNLPRGCAGSVRRSGHAIDGRTSLGVMPK